MECPLTAYSCSEGVYVVYEMFWDNRQVGTASVVKEGLYYLFHCECSLPKNDIYKISVSDGTSVINLGICIPEKEKFILKTKIPVKYLSIDKITFTVMSKNTDKILIRNYMQFDSLDKLETARLENINGQLFIVIS